MTRPGSIAKTAAVVTQELAPTDIVATRPAQRADMPALRPIWREFMEAHASRDDAFALAEDAEDRWQQMAFDLMGRDDSFVLVSTVDGTPRGLCVGWVARNPPIYSVAEIGFIAEICVSRSHFRRGIGRALMAAARTWFAARGLAEFQLATAIWNIEAQTYWRQQGGEASLVRYRFVL